MAEALYRKYRPSTFAEVAEQGHVVRTISNQLMAGKVAHAYLFAGPRGVGKTTIARLLAKSLNCESRAAGSAEPCNACGICLDANLGRFLDTVEIDAASQTKVEETRENIIENVRFAPSRGKYKVFIIDEVHMLSTSSFNALLKTLEEPPAHVVFILATTELHKIPATIISRCQRFDFHRIPAQEMIERLQTIATAEGFTVEAEVYASIARLSEGCLRDAESLLGQVFALGEKNITLEAASLIIPATHIGTVIALADELTKRNAAGALKVINTFVEEGGSVRHVLDELVEFVRSMLFAALGSNQHESYDTDTVAKLTAFAKRLPALDLQRLLDVLLSARGRSTPSQYPQLPLEIAMAQFCLAVNDDTSVVRRPSGAVTGNTSHPEPSSLFVSKVNGLEPLSAAAQIRHPEVTKDPNGLVTPSSATSVATTSPDARRTTDAVSPRLKLPELPELSVVPVQAAAISNQSSGTGTSLTEAEVEEIRSKWGRCVSWVGEKNVALPLILNNAQVLRFENGRLVVGFPYAMHADKMNQTKNLRLMEDAVNAITMKQVNILFVHDKPPETEAVEDLLQAFGGEVV